MNLVQTKADRPIFSKKQVALSALTVVFFLVFQGFLLVSHYAEQFAVNSGQIRNIEYFSCAGLEDAESISGEIKSIDSFSQIQCGRGENYVYVRFQLPASGVKRQIEFYTFFSQSIIRINDNEKIHTIDTANQTGYFGNTAHISVSVDPSADTQTVEFIEQCSVSPYLQILINRAGQTGFPFITILLFIAGALCLLSVILLAVNILLGKTNTDFGKRPYKWIQIALFFGMSLCFLSLRIAGPAMFLMKLGLAVIQLSEMAFFYYFSQRFLPYTLRQIIVSIGIAIAAIEIANPYEAFNFFLLKLYGFFFPCCLLVCIIIRVVRQIRMKDGRRTVELDDWIVCFTNILIHCSIWAFFYLESNQSAEQIYLPMLLCAAYFVYIEFAGLKRAGLHAKGRKCNSGGAAAVSSDSLMIYKPTNLGRIQDLLDLFLKNSDNRNHARNVSLYVYCLCRNANRTEEQSVMAAQAAFLHDIGKMMLPNTLTKSSELLNHEEFAQMKQHTIFGYNLFKNGSSELMNTAAEIARSHHERVDGNGYYGLTEDQISPYVLITAIADVFDATTTKRSYKKAWSFQEGFEYIQSHSGTMFSAEYVNVFVNSRDEIYRIYCQTRD